MRLLQKLEEFFGMLCGFSCVILFLLLFYPACHGADAADVTDAMAWSWAKLWAKLIIGSAGSAGFFFLLSYLCAALNDRLKKKAPGGVGAEPPL